MGRAEPLRILGVDPGSVTTGYGLIEECGGALKLIVAGAVTVPSELGMPDRLHRIFERLEQVIADGSPQEVAVESLFHAKNARSALLLGHARGVALLAAARRGLPVYEYAPQAVKNALVGTGRAEKRQVQSMVRILLALAADLRPLDASDGTAVAICHAHARRLRVLVERAEQRRPLPAGR